MNRSTLLTILLFFSKITSFPATDVWWQQRNQDSYNFWLISKDFSVSQMKVDDNDIAEHAYNFYLSLDPAIQSKYHFAIYLENIETYLPLNFKSAGPRRLSWEQLLCYAKKNNQDLVNKLISKSIGMALSHEKSSADSKWGADYSWEERDFYAVYLTQIDAKFFNEESFKFFTDEINQPSLTWSKLLEFAKEDGVMHAETIQQTKNWRLAKICYQVISKSESLSKLLEKAQLADLSTEKTIGLIYYFYLSNLESFTCKCNLFTSKIPTPQEFFFAFTEKAGPLIPKKWQNKISLEGFLLYVKEEQINLFFDKDPFDKQVFLEQIGKLLTLAMQLGSESDELKKNKNELIEEYIEAYGDKIERHKIRSYINNFETPN